MICTERGHRVSNLATYRLRPNSQLRTEESRMAETISPVIVRGVSPGTAGQLPRCTDCGELAPWVYRTGRLGLHLICTECMEERFAAANA